MESKDLSGNTGRVLFCCIGKSALCGARISKADSWKRRIITTLFCPITGTGERRRGRWKISREALRRKKSTHQPISIYQERKQKL